MSVDKPSGGDRRPDQVPGPEHRAFPGRPADRPPVPPPTGTKTAEEMRAERAQYKTTSEYNAAAAAERAARRRGSTGTAETSKGAPSDRPGTGPREAAGPGAVGRTGTVPARGDIAGQQPGGTPDRGRLPRPDAPGARGPEGLTRPDRHRPADYKAFPGRPADRPPVTPPAGTKTAEEMRAERAKYKTTSEYNAAATAEKAAARRAAAKDTSPSAAREPAAGKPVGLAAERGTGPRDQGRPAADQQRESQPACETPAPGLTEKTNTVRETSVKPRAESPAAEVPAARPETPRLADGTPRPGSDHPGPPAQHEGTGVGQTGETGQVPDKPRPAHDAGPAVGSGESAARRHRDDGLPPEGTLGPHLSWTTLPPEARTLGDTTPTGIGLKPDGDQLLDMAGDRPKNRFDRLLDEMMDGADDLHDAAGSTAEALDDLARGSGPSAHAAHAGHLVSDRPQQVSSNVNDAVGASVVLVAATAAAVRHLILNHRRDHERDHLSH